MRQLPNCSRRASQVMVKLKELRQVRIKGTRRRSRRKSRRQNEWNVMNGAIRSVLINALVLFLIVGCSRMVGNTSVRGTTTASSGSAPSIENDSVVCDLLPAKDLSPHHTISDYEIIHFYSPARANGYLNCIAYYDQAKNPELYMLTIEYRCRPGSYRSVADVKASLSGMNVAPFAIGGIDGEGISLYDSRSSEALWQYDDGCQLRVRQTLGYGYGHEELGDPKKDVVDLVRLLVRRAPQVAEGPSRDRTHYPPKIGSSATSSPTN